MWARLPPLVRAASVSCCSMAVGDTLCQAIRCKAAKREVSIDWQQSARFGLIGATLHGPVFFHGFRWLDARFGAAASLQTAAIKTAVGQFTLFPVYLGSFFAYMGLLEGLPPRQCVQKVQQAFVPTYTMGWGFWPVANIVNFMWVPATQRVLFANMAGLAWNAILSLANSTKGQVAAAGGTAPSGGGSMKKLR